MKTTATKKFHFCYAHRLPQYNGKCSNMHGHNAEVEVTVSGTYRGPGEYHGMVVDFGILKNIVSPSIEAFDHCTINDLMLIPTAENIADLFR